MNEFYNNLPNLQLKEVVMILIGPLTDWNQKPTKIRLKRIREWFDDVITTADLLKDKIL